MLEKIALQKKLISEKDCRDAVDACRSSENFEEALKDYFITHDLISLKTLEQLIQTIDAVKIIKKNIKFGTIAMEMGLISKETLEAALDHQKKAAAENRPPKLIGRILYDSGKLTKEQLQQVIQEQNKRNLKLEMIRKEDLLQSQERHIPEKEAEPEEKAKGKDIAETVPGGMVLEVENNGMSAFLRKTEDFDHTLTADDIYSLLLSRDIRYGIEGAEAVEGFIKSSGFKKKRFKIAAGTPKIAGNDARIEYYFDTDHLKAGQVDEEGKIDFKNRGEIPRVEAKTLLAEKFPFTESKNGKDIYGNELLATPSKDISLKIKTGVILSEDGMKVSAEQSGHPKLSWSGSIGVIDMIVVKGDVGYETGHLQYSGNIEVQGGLKSGFRINGFDIKINEADGGEIHAQGDVTITGGVNDAVIYSRGHVSAKYIHNSKINCLGNVYVEKEIVDSQIESSGSCRIMTGDIVNSAISFNQGIFVKNIGTERTTPNKIVVGCDLFIVRELKKIESRVAELAEKRQALEKTKEKLLQDNRELLKSTTRMANELEMMDSKQKEPLFFKLENELNDCFNLIEKNEIKIIEIDRSCDDCKDQTEDLNQEKINFTDWVKANPGNPVVVADGRVCAGTIIHGAHAQKELMEIISRVEIREIRLQINNTFSDIYEIQINENLRRR
ncbi:MAG: hypothetical protein A2097_03495 [Desulfobacula sp. GWF2_41_7]|nr:MAG: hypothetical protein A2097_03495 [Desulfobacula sp. GWF2_41_7]